LLGKKVDQSEIAAKEVSPKTKKVSTKVVAKEFPTNMEAAAAPVKNAAKKANLKDAAEKDEAPVKKAAKKAATKKSVEETNEAPNNELGEIVSC
jgi:hypothetical protein